MQDLAQLFTLLSEPVRLQILGRLASGEQCVCKIFEALGLPQSTVSRHLALFRAAGIVAARRKGTWMHYRLTPESWPEEWRTILELVIAEASSRSDIGEEIVLCNPAGRKNASRADRTDAHSER